MRCRLDFDYRVTQQHDSADWIYFDILVHSRFKRSIIITHLTDKARSIAMFLHWVSLFTAISVETVAAEEIDVVSLEDFDIDSMDADGAEFSILGDTSHIDHKVDRLYQTFVFVLCVNTDCAAQSVLDQFNRIQT